MSDALAAPTIVAPAALADYIAAARGTIAPNTERAVRSDTAVFTSGAARQAELGNELIIAAGRLDLALPASRQHALL